MKQVVVLQLLWTTFAVSPFKIACPFPNPLPPSQKKKTTKIIFPYPQHSIIFTLLDGIMRILYNYYLELCPKQQNL